MGNILNVIHENFQGKGPKFMILVNFVISIFTYITGCKNEILVISIIGISVILYCAHCEHFEKLN